MSKIIQERIAEVRLLILDFRYRILERETRTLSFPPLGLGAYSLFLNSSPCFSKPGLLSSANIFFLYASTPGWSKGFTPNM